MSDDHRAAEIRRELRAEIRDDYRGTVPAYYILRGEAVVGFVFWEDESWRCGWSQTDSTKLEVPFEQGVDAGLDRIAAQLADAGQ